MPCGERCKQIIDNGAAVKRAINCMTNTVLLKHAGDVGPTHDQAARLAQKSQELATICAEIEQSFGTV